MDYKDMTLTTLIDSLRKSAADKDEITNRIAGIAAERRVKYNDKRAKFAMLLHMLKTNKL